MADARAHSEFGNDPGEPLQLSEKLDLRASLDLLADLRARRGSDLAIDAGHVQHLGAHAVQTLLVAADSWARDGNKLVVENLTDAARGHLSILGLRPEQLSSGGAA
ncbi:MAG: STAS domain-containing protein [Pseudomonadota bacterium]